VISSRLEGKVAVITGGCRGIGRAITLRLISEGALCFALDYKLLEEGEIFTDNPDYLERVKFIQVDVTSDSSVKASFEEVLKEAGRIDILVNNAGITRDNLLLRMNETEWDSVIDTNLKGAFLCTKAVLKPMMSQRWGRIINIASIVGITGNAGQSNYSASKAGLIGFTKSIAQEVGSRNILVNAIAPGFVLTQMTDKLTEQQKQNFLDDIPLKRAATPQDIANCVAFYASEDSSYITGNVIIVDGGLSM
jgi:3-oxoacyl-[acyl-carrier protein] reductase